MDARRTALADFLRRTRAAVTPETAGFRRRNRRRAAGLLREEVATLAGINVEWYTRIERGRDVRVTSTTLAAIADALRLAPHERTYLDELCAERPVRPMPSTLTAPLHIVREPSSVPMVVATAAFTPMAWNDAAATAFGLDLATPPLRRHPFWRALFDPALRLDEPREMTAQAVAGLLRRAAARCPYDEDIPALVRAMSQSAPFAAAWESHCVETYPTPRRFLGGGTLSIAYGGDAGRIWRPLWVTLPESPDRVLAIYTPVGA